MDPMDPMDPMELGRPGPSGRPGRPALPGHPPTTSRERQRPARFVLTGCALVLLVWFAAANLQVVRIHFWIVTEGAPLIVVIAISGSLGAVSAGLWSRVRRRRAARSPR